VVAVFRAVVDSLVAAAVVVAVVAGNMLDLVTPGLECYH
jgi:hypothetical protein